MTAKELLEKLENLVLATSDNLNFQMIENEKTILEYDMIKEQFVVDKYGFDMYEEFDFEKLDEFYVVSCDLHFNEENGIENKLTLMVERI